MTIKIEKIPEFGEAGPHVLALQTALKAAGFSPGELDGAFGGATRAAAQKFQKKQGLKGTGVLGPKTIGLLDLEVDKKAPPVSTPMTKFPHVAVKSPRKLPSALEVLIDKAVDFKVFQKLLSAKDYGGLVVLACEALESLKIREKTNKNDGYLVELVQKVSGGQRGYAWCMYAVMCAVAWVELKTGVVSKLPSSGSCASVRGSASKSIQVASKDSMPGDVWIWIYKTGLGHTGIFGGWKTKLKTAYLFEGNTTKGLGKDGKIEREGGGYYRTERAFEISGMRLGMVCRPF